jgi:hypothetical protein
VTPQSTADLVANLERRKLVRRDRNPDNRRELVVSLTASGHKLLAEYAAAVAALEQDMTAELDRTGVETFRSYLDACRVALNRTRRDEAARSRTKASLAKDQGPGVNRAAGRYASDAPSL